MNIDLNNPETYDQIEAIGALNKALFNLGKAYGLKSPGKLVTQVRWNIKYELENLLKSEMPKATIVNDDSSTSGSPIIDESPDTPVNLEDIQF